VEPHNIKGVNMSFLRYIKDCLDFAKEYPLNNGKRLLWIRNILYLNAQPKYWHGWLITKLL